MDKNLLVQIAKTEQVWLPLLGNEVKRLFEGVSIPSHDFFHHLRVWNYSKELLIAFEKTGFSDDFIESLMLAVFFHDTGLSQTADENHGMAGCSFFEQFAAKHGLQKMKRFQEISLAIINHDDKEYSDSSHPGARPGIYHFLTVADDLDAFGALGLLRYFEIYCRRNIPADQLADRIEKNLKNRFLFVGKLISTQAELYSRHEKRYLSGLSVLSILQIAEIEKLVALLSDNLFVSELALLGLKDENLRRLIDLAALEEKVFER